MEKGFGMDFRKRLGSGREMYLAALGAGIFKLFADAYPLRDFAKLNLHPGNFDQPAKNEFFNRLSVYYNRNTRSALR